jgi:hypothetical protein
VLWVRHRHPPEIAERATVEAEAKQDFRDRAVGTEMQHT